MGSGTVRMGVKLVRKNESESGSNRKEGIALNTSQAELSRAREP